MQLKVRFIRHSMIIQILYLKEQAVYAVILNAVEREISLLFRDNTDSVFKRKKRCML